MYLGHDGQVQVYENATIQPGSPINSDLLLDQSEANIYVMARNTVCLPKANILLLNVSKCTQNAMAQHCFARHQKQPFHSKPRPRCLLSGTDGRLSFTGRTIYRLSGLFWASDTSSSCVACVDGIKQKSGGRRKHPERPAGRRGQRSQLAVAEATMVLIRADGPPLCRHAPLKCELKSLIDGHSYREPVSREGAVEYR